MSSDNKTTEVNSQEPAPMAMDYATDAAVRVKVTEGLMMLASKKGKNFTTKLTDGCNSLAPLVNLLHKIQTEVGIWYVDGRDEYFSFMKTEGSTLPKKPTPEDLDTHRYELENLPKIECGFIDLARFGATRIEGPVVYRCKIMEGGQIGLCGVVCGPQNERVQVPIDYNHAELAERLTQIASFCHRRKVEDDMEEFRISRGPAPITSDCIYIIQHHQREEIVKGLYEEVKRICMSINAYCK